MTYAEELEHALRLASDSADTNRIRKLLAMQDLHYARVQLYKDLQVAPSAFLEFLDDWLYSAESALACTEKLDHLVETQPKQ